MYHTQSRLIRTPHFRIGREHFRDRHSSAHRVTECPKGAIANARHRGGNQTIGKLKLSNAHRQRVTILYLQGRVYYAFFTR
ncbi:hypothetical protein D083_2847 [Dickeya solani RNS 08.23.3.1.A]|nr:hypothetical protein D083_2847 [Dickeya solani RNS 08.23.3.1.A]